MAYDTKLLSCEELDGAEGADSSNSSSGLPDEPYRYRLVFGERRAAAAGNSSSSSVDMSSSGGDSQARGGQAGPEDSASGFQAGLEVRAKVVVGADGYFSRVRREVRGWHEPGGVRPYQRRVSGVRKLVCSIVGSGKRACSPATLDIGPL